MSTTTTTCPAIQELSQHKHWVSWRLVTRNGKPTKPPISPHTGRAAAVDNPATWGSYAAAQQAVERYNLSGSGFMLTTALGYLAWDLDHCLQDGMIVDERAADIVRRLNSYTYIPPSGDGLRVIVRAALPPQADGREGRRTGNVEVYGGARFITLTEQLYPGAPDTIEARQAEADALCAELFPPKPAPTPRAVSTAARLDDQEIINLASRARNGGKFDRLLRGDTSDYAGDGSRADGGLAYLLAFFTDDFNQILRIIQLSGLWDAKWERPDYQQRTIEDALSNVTEHYSPSATKIVFTDSVKTPTPQPLAAALGLAAASATVDPCAERVAALERQLLAAQAEADQLRAKVRELRLLESRRAQVMANPKMSEGAKLMLLALAPEIAGVRSGAGGKIGQPDRRIVGNAIHIDLTTISQRIGCKPDAAGDRLTKLAKAGLFKKSYRPKINRDPETGQLRQGDTGRELLIEPIFAEIGALLTAGAQAETAGRANQGGKRPARTCPDHPTARLIHDRTDRYVCEDCGQITAETTVRAIIDPNRQLDGSGADAPVAPLVANVLNTVKLTVREPASPSRQVDGSGDAASEDVLDTLRERLTSRETRQTERGFRPYAPTTTLPESSSAAPSDMCGLCRRPLRNDAERQSGCHSYDCLEPVLPPASPSLHAAPAWGGGSDD